MNTSKILKWALPAIIVIAFSACKKKDPVIPNQEELITTLTLTLTPTGTGPEVAFVFQDIDGDGGNPPVVTGPDSLMADQSYTATVGFLNEAISPVTNITDEVNAEATQHQVFYRPTAGLNTSVNYSDADENGDPIGLNVDLTTGAACSGQLTVTLRHQPNKTAASVMDGDITNAGGETDIEVTFDVTIL
jgi:hypothetical protein